MAGSAENTALWDGADVYIAAVGTAGPADLTSAWATEWRPVGLLNGEEGFTESREDETSEHYAWGGILYRRTRSKHKRTIRFVALEDNDVVFSLVNPGSARAVDPETGIKRSTVRVPTAAQFAVGFETRDGDTIRRRVVARAEVQEVGEIKDSESEPTIYEITVLIFPTSDGVLYEDIESAPAAGPEEEPTTV